MDRRIFIGQALIASATAVVAAPVPKVKEKVDPGEPWAFPDLKSKGWVELKDGLKVWDVKEGEGDTCPAGATVTVHYTGWLTDAKEFDSSKKQDRPLTYSLDQLVKGWQVGIPGMKPGGIRRLYVPSELGYGARGAGGVIPPDSTLVFVIELIEAKK
jgi:FKBP-type peptidyl-prolyl cis-trans isomerase